MPAQLEPTTDGVVTIRPPGLGDAARLIAGRDAEFHRFLGEGSQQPRPTGCIEVAGEVVGWVDFDTDREWLAEGEVNLGYNVFAPRRRAGFASRAVQLLMHHLSQRTEHRTATLLIDPANAPSLALAARLGFEPQGDVGGNAFLTRAVPPRIYTDGVVTIRPQREDDVEADLDAKDDEQIRWLWLPGQREQWEAMTPAAQWRHAVRGLRANREAFGRGPKWTFAVDVVGGPSYVAYIDCDLANPNVAAGQANVSYSAHPAHRGRGHVSRAARLVTEFVADNTGATEVHLIVDEANEASLRVARAIGAEEQEHWVDAHGRPMVRHVLPVRPEVGGTSWSW